MTKFYHKTINELTPRFMPDRKYAIKNKKLSSIGI